MYTKMSQQQDKWGNCRVAKTTLKRLDQHGEYRSSYDKIIVKILDQVEGKRK